MAAVLILAATLNAQDYTYSTPGGTQRTITRYTGSGGAVNIPEMIEGLPVTVIGRDAFNGRSSLTSIIIPNTVTNVGEFAFYRCNNLTVITIGTNVASIGASAFGRCDSLGIVTVPSGVTAIGNFAFGRCSSLTNMVVDTGNIAYSSLNGVLFDAQKSKLIQYPSGSFGSYAIPDGVTSIWQSAFSHCEGLVDVMIPDTVTNIGEAAFSSCEGLNSFSIPDGVTSIEESAFSNCGNLTSVIIGKGLTFIGSQVFDGCTNMTSIVVSPMNSTYSSLDGVFFNKEQTTLIGFPPGRLGSYEIPPSAIRIDDNAFRNCSGLTEVGIPSSVISIGSGAFEYCGGLTNITISPNVTFIGTGAFRYCRNLNRINFEGNAPSFEDVGTVFAYTDDAKVFYLSGTTDWAAWYGYTQTVLWDPKIETGGEYFGIYDNQFGFTITAISEPVVAIEACTDLIGADWNRLQTLTIIDGSAEFIDIDWATHPGRFYRLRMP